MGCALSGDLRASPSEPPAQAPHGVGCDQRPSHEHERPASRLRVRPFPATVMTPAGSTASADFSTASDTLASIAVPSHPANTPSVTGHPGTPAEISTSKTNNLHRTPTAFTERPLDDIGLRLVVQTRPDRPALYAQPTDTTKAPMRHVFLGSRLRTPASSPPSLTTERLPSACGWCHQPPQGTRTPELLVMSRAHRACGSPAHGSPTSFTGWHTQASASPFRSGDRCPAGSPTYSGSGLSSFGLGVRAWRWRGSRGVR
jgi:hypothetical protein